MDPLNDSQTRQGKLERAKSQAASELAAAAQGDNAEELRKARPRGCSICSMGRSVIHTKWEYHEDIMVICPPNDVDPRGLNQWGFKWLTNGFYMNLPTMAMAISPT